MVQTRPYRYAKWSLLLGLVGRLGYVYGTRYQKTILVTKSFHHPREKRHGIENEYMIADENQQLYRVTSSFWYWQWYPEEL